MPRERSPLKAGAPYLTRGFKIGRMASALSRAHASRARAGTPRGLDAFAPSGVAREGPSGPIGPEWPEWPEWPERARVARVGPASRARIGTPRGLDAFATSGCIIYTQARGHLLWVHNTRAKKLGPKRARVGRVGPSGPSGPDQKGPLNERTEAPGPPDRHRSTKPDPNRDHGKGHGHGLNPSQGRSYKPGSKP